MKILVVNDNPAINTILEEILTDDGHEVKCLSKLDEAEVELITFKPDAIIIEETIGGEDAMKFIDMIDKDSAVKVLMLSNGKRLPPKDKPMIVGFVRKPFKAVEILEPIRRIRDGDDAVPVTTISMEDKKAKRSIFGVKKQKEEPKEEEDSILRFGKSFVVYEPYPKIVFDATKELSFQGCDIFVISFDTKKTIWSMLGDKEVEVMTISAKGKWGVTDAAALGTIMATIMTYIDRNIRPAIVIDDLNKLIGANDLNRAITFICQIMQGASKQFTMLVSVAEEQFTEKDKLLFAQYMERYNRILEDRPEEVTQ